MTKKIALGLVALVAMAAGVAGLSAFEAHVINVTAKIENALRVKTDPIDFGTVFPQEQLDRRFVVELSESFIAEDRVDDVEYIIRQKPKCGVTTDNGTVLVGPTATGHVGVNASGTVEVDCGPDPRAKDAAGNPLPLGSAWDVLPSLCEYLSKHEQTEDGQEGENDGSLNAFHSMGHVDDKGTIDPSDDEWVWNDVDGRLAKSAPDITDVWNLDLKVPCFGGNCAQDWEDFVLGINASATPAEYVQDIANEHKIFGCDVWIEVTEVSESSGDQTGPI